MYDRLANGIGLLRLNDGSSLATIVTRPSDNHDSYPYLFCFSYRHPDASVNGRLWVTEIGLHKETQTSPMRCTFLLKTDAISSRVESRIKTTRPAIVQKIASACDLLEDTPGLRIQNLTLESCEAHRYAAELESRRHPLIVISADSMGRYPVDCSRIQSLFIGLADVLLIPPSENTHAMESAIGRRYIAFNGAINIIYPRRTSERYPDTFLLHPAKLDEVLARGTAIETELLSIVTHRSNLPISWKHVSPDRVRQEVSRRAFGAALEMGGKASAAEVQEVYDSYLKEKDEEIESNARFIDDLLLQLEDAESEKRKLQAKADGLEHALRTAGINENHHESDNDQFRVSRDFIQQIADDELTLETVVGFIESSFSDRVVILESAHASARESDRSGYRKASKALDLLLKLVTDYWTDIASGGSDQTAKKIFGKDCYAANEASALSNDGRKRRTFSYKDQDYVMEKHLRLGVKDSIAETLRIHFEWIASEKRIVVGHCGKHLNF